MKTNSLIPTGALVGACFAAVLTGFAALANSAEQEDPARMTPQKDAEQRWQRPPDGDIQGMLTSEQYQVTQHEGTEPPFRNAYWDHKGEGIYVDVVSGEPLFSSREKYRSGTGWPSFYAPLEPAHLVEKKDRTLWMVRTEVRSRNGDSHLGHLFNDGPEPTGLRYCINSAALRFIPREDLDQEGYGEYARLFNESR